MNEQNIYDNQIFFDSYKKLRENNDKNIQFLQMSMNNLSDYSLLGERNTAWIIDNVIKYHRSFSSILNSLSDSGFTVEKVLEPLPDEKIMNQYPAYKKYYHKPDFLLVKVRKTRTHPTKGGI